MSTQNINTLSKERYFSEFDQELQDLNNQYFNYKNFRVGSMPQEDKVKHTMIFRRIMCEDNCELVNYINDKLKGKLDKKCHVKKHKSKRLSYILRTAYEYTKTQDCTLEEAVECQDIWFQN